MTDGPKIPAALTPKQWAAYRERRLTFDPILDEIIGHPNPEAPARAIAIANDQLREGDPRKITRARVMRLRDAADQLKQHGVPSPAWDLRRMADVFDSYLSPET